MRLVTALVAPLVVVSVLVPDAQVGPPPPTPPAQQTGTANPTAQTPQTAAPRRTEAEARAAADRNRKAREEERKKTGAPVELISNYIKANILPVPASLGVDPFYTKYVDAQGIPVISSDKVPDDALLVARDIINSMLARRPDLRASMVKRRWRTGVIAEVEMTMDIPEYSRMKRPGAPRDEPVNQLDRDYHANRSRGLGGNPTTGAEENLLGYPGTRYFGEHIFVHEFAHAIMTAVRDVDPKMHAEIGEAYKEAMAAGKYLNTPERKHYATTNAGEYWAEGVQWWFFSNFGECFISERGNIRVDTPEEFAAYDPKLNELISRVFDSHRIPMDVFHGKQLRKLNCGAPAASAASALEPAATQTANTLSAAEKAAGWRLLFDGASTTGWHVFGGGRVTGWEIADGTLIALGQNGGHDIVTDDEFENFELAVDWKLSPRANSGIFFNVVEKGYKVVYDTGPEYQLIDDDGWPGGLQDWQRTGANYAMHPPLTRAAKPVGEWNHTRIVVNRGHVGYFLNGAKTAEYVMWTPDWEKLVTTGKWKDFPGYGRARKGRIGLQDHGNKVWFRNIKVRTL